MRKAFPCHDVVIFMTAIMSFTSFQMRRDVTPTSKQEDVTSLQSECARLTSKEADLDRQIQELRDGYGQIRYPHSIISIW